MRTKKTTRNFIVSTILTTAIAIIGLIKSKIFIQYLGDEITGIYQLFSQIYSYISLVDAGLTSSLLFSLYKPISENNYDKINSILKSGRKFFNIIGVIILILGIIVSFKIDFFLNGHTLSLMYIQICFMLFILASTINYLVTARKILFEADQNLYIVHIAVYGFMIIKAIVEIILALSGLKLISLMLAFVITSILQNLFIYILSKKKYKYLTFKGQEDKSFIKQSKNLIVQKIADIIFNNIDILLISKFIGTTSIVIYTSYNYIINALLNIIKKIGTSSLASIGNLLITEKEKAKNIFLEYNALCFFIASLISIPLLYAITPFIKLYYGAQYILPTIGTISVVVLFFLRIINIPQDTFITALGYFDKIKNCTIIESIINLVLSIALIFKLGITGVIIATIVSFLYGIFYMHPRILNKNYFVNSKLNYYSQSTKLLIGTLISAAINYLIYFKFPINNIFEWLIFGILSFIVNAIILTIYYKLIKEDRFIERFTLIFKNILHRKKAK